MAPSHRETPRSLDPRLEVVLFAQEPDIVHPVALAFVVLVVYSLGFTIFNVPYLTMPVEMTADRMQRLSIMSYRSVFMMLGSVAGSVWTVASTVELIGPRPLRPRGGTRRCRSSTTQPRDAGVSASYGSLSR